jgi:sterol desaturase/sphingolipid hydroxylase (fatty acid hydroxylase superfamily)
MAKDSFSHILGRFIGLSLSKWKGLIGIGVVLGIGNLFTATLFHLLQGIYYGDCTISSALHFQITDFSALGIVPIFLGSLLLEAMILGWNSSSIYRLFESPTASSKTDLFYLVLIASNLSVFSSLLFTFGLGYFLEATLQKTLGWNLMHESSVFLQAVTQLFVGSFIFYWQHRLQHNRFLWEYHKLHHAAQEMTLANNFRSHPVMYCMRACMEVIPGAILGIRPSVLLLYSALTGTIVLWQHTSVNWNMPWVERHIFIGSRGHRIHHSLLEKHYNRNIGYLVLWDWLFGTLTHWTETHDVPIGVEDPRYNNESPVREMIDIFFCGNRVFFRESALWIISKL